VTDQAPRSLDRFGIVFAGLVTVGWIAVVRFELPSPERGSAWLLVGAIGVVFLVPGAISSRWAATRGTTRVRLTVTGALALTGAGMIIQTLEPLVKVVIGGALAGFLLGVAILWPRPNNRSRPRGDRDQAR
jgi:membrane associated rhomboid family serine protease